MPTASDRVRHYGTQHALVVTSFLLVTLVQTWPLIGRLSRVLPNDLGDPVLNTWILWWDAHAIPLTQAWWNAPMFYPTRGALAFSETLLGLAWITSPLQGLGFSPVTAYNLSFLLSFPLSAFAAYLLAWNLTGRAAASIVAGAIYGYAAFRFAHLGHLQILWSWWMPLALLGLHQSFPTAQNTRVGDPVRMTEGWRSALLLFGLCWLGQSLSNGYYFFYFSIIIVFWLAWFTPWRRAPRLLLPVLAIWMAAIACLSPVLLMYLHVHGEQHLQRDYGEIAGRGADLLDFFTSASADREERNLTLGIVATAALTAGIVAAARDAVRRDRSPLVFYVLATLVALVLALGPTPRVGGMVVMEHGPYEWLMTIVPGMTGVRVPARFTLVAVLCLAIATALLLARVQSATATSAARARLVTGAVLLLAVLAVIETWPRPRIPLVRLPPVPDAIALSRDSRAVLELPVGQNEEFSALYRAMFHRRPLVNGYSGYTPASYDELRLCLAKKDADCLTPLRRLGPLDILIARANDNDNWEAFIAELPDTRLQYHTQQFTVFHLPALPAR